VIGHECGHSAFSSYDIVNNIVGFILHSFLIVPYFSWKISHAGHHKYNVHMDNDTLFVPPKKSEYIQPNSATHKFYMSKINVILRLLNLVTMGFIIYLSTNAKGKRFDSPWANHFNPNAPLFTKNQKKLIIISDIGIVCVLILLGYLSYHFGIMTMFKLYGLCYMTSNFWITMISLIHHTDLKIPHLADSEWTWLKGAIATVDRDFGFFINTILHHIHDTHICHHIFPQLPHYHTVEATKYLKPILGKYYTFDDTFFLKALWNAYVYCEFIDDEETIAYFKHY